MTARTVPIELDKPRTLRFYGKAVRLLKHEHGINIFADDTDISDPDTLTLMLWAGLIHEDSDLTVEQVEEMWDVCQIPYITQKFAEVMGGEEGPDPFETSSA